MKLQCVVTSYRRPKYLKPCLESMRQDDISLCVVDGGSDEETCEYIRRTADRAIFLKGNPGADVLKAEGIKRFVTDPQFVVSADDYLFPAGWTDVLFQQYKALRPLGYVMLACPTEQVIAHHYTGSPNWEPDRKKYNVVAGYEIMDVGCAMTCGAIVDSFVAKRVGHFPVYGKSGQGDWAMGSRIRKLGFKSAYLAKPQVEHLGRTKANDYPDYNQMCIDDCKRWQKPARTDGWRP